MFRTEPDEIRNRLLFYSSVIARIIYCNEERKNKYINHVLIFFRRFRMIKSENFPHRTNHSGATNLRKSLTFKNWSAQITSGFGAVLEMWIYAWNYYAFVFKTLWRPILLKVLHCVKSVCIRNFSGPYFPVFGLNTEKYEVSLRIQSECGKTRTRKTPNTDTFT